MIPYFTITPQNSPENSVLYATRLYLNDFVHVCLLSPYFLISVPTNVFNMAVFRKHDNEERISLCFACLSLALSFLFSILQCRQIKCNKRVQLLLTFNVFIKIFYFFLKQNEVKSPCVELTKGTTALDRQGTQQRPESPTAGNSHLVCYKCKVHKLNQV